MATDKQIEAAANAVYEQDMLTVSYIPYAEYCRRLAKAALEAAEKAGE